MDLRDYIASIPDYPEKGIVFRDISPLMANGDAYREATKQIVDYAKEKELIWLYNRKLVALLSAVQWLMN